MTRGRRDSVVALAVLLLATIAAVPSTGAYAGGSPIPAGYDLFETDPGQTQLSFQVGDTAIPAGFFGPGSDPFTGVVRFGGKPLGSFMGKPVGDTDTIVRRPNGADPNPVADVPIEIVALNLVSVEPIRVTDDGGQKPQLWDVMANLSPTLPSHGSMRITRALAGAGGTFESQLQVIPKLTFTRIGDGQVRVLDAAILPQQTLAKLILRSRNVPWQPGCTLPALEVPGINDGFCPGLDPAGRKRLTLEQALLAQHGVYPAQPQLEHFRCYALGQAPFVQRQVTLTDQFGRRSAQVTSRKELCNPARKNLERFKNRAAHLQCYATSGAALDELVAVQNQFGSQRLKVGRPTRLCLPTRKRLILSTPTTLPPITVPIDHFQCYAVTAVTGLRTVTRTTQVTLKDQFRTETVQVGDPFQVCAPVRKDDTRVQHRVKHLVCYRTTGEPIDRRVAILNQFERVRLHTIAPKALCVPSNKLPLAS